MFSKKQRISRREFSSIYKGSRSFHFPPMNFKVSLRKYKGQKFSVVLPGVWQKQKSLRNKTKRRVVEIIKKQKKDLPENINIICFLKKEVASLKYVEISQKINHSLRKISESFPRDNK